MGDIIGIKTAGGYELQHVMNFDGEVTTIDNPNVCYYKHFDLTTEQLGKTWRYNCWGFTFLPRRYWINSSTDADMIFLHNCNLVANGSLRPGDLIRYQKYNEDLELYTTHAGRVWEVDNNGYCTKVRSKWGSNAEFIHNPNAVNNTYGGYHEYFRQHSPLQGIGDLWIRDAWNDNGEQYSQSLWASPDILVDAPPYGSVNLNPVFNVPNRVWAIVHNRSNYPIFNVRVRYYWVDPHVGFNPSSWQLIPGTADYPNPTQPFSISPNSSREAPYVEWTPQPVEGVDNPGHQCLLAIAYCNDNPIDWTNPDPIVYPFAVRWENNLAARNVHVIEGSAGDNNNFTILTGIPFDGVERVIATLRLKLVYAPRLPIFGFPKKVIPLDVKYSLDKGRFRSLFKKIRSIEPFKKTWGPGVKPRLIDYELIGPDRLAPETFLERREKVIGWGEIKRVYMTAGKSRQLHVRVNIPKTVQVGSNYYLRIEQEIRGEITGCYTAVIMVVA